MASVVEGRTAGLSWDNNPTTDASLRSNQQLPQAPAQLPPCGSRGASAFLACDDDDDDDGGGEGPALASASATPLALASAAAASAEGLGRGAPGCAAVGLTSASANKSVAATVTTAAAAAAGPGRRVWRAMVVAAGPRGTRCNKYPAGHPSWFRSSSDGTTTKGIQPKPKP
jgi:hypothetical protein